MPSLADFLSAVPGATCSPSVQSVQFQSVGTDSRSIQPGALFVALSGPTFDGHDFLLMAQERGASAAIVSRSDLTPVAGLPFVQVPDTLLALQQWAMAHRDRWHGPVIAVTGSNGKTTVKQMIAAIGAQAFGGKQAWATPGNLNNHIGVPLSVLGLLPSHKFAVLELGMNHPGEIAGLAAIAKPSVGLVNNAQREHQEFMKSVEAVAQENGQILASLPTTGVAIFPKDPAHEAIWRRQAGTRRMIRFGFRNAPAAPAYSGEELIGDWYSAASGERLLRVTLPDQQTITISPKGAGDHFALNLLAAAACTWASGIPADVIALALNQFAPVKGRGLQLALAGGGLVIDDTYNANPDSVRAAIDALVAMPQPQMLVLGDMGEVGDQGDTFHDEVLHYAADQKIESLWLHGEAMAKAASRTKIGRHQENLPQLIALLQTAIRQAQSDQQRPSVWVKGSRFMRMERVVEALIHPTGDPAPCC